MQTTQDTLAKLTFPENRERYMINLIITLLLFLSVIYALYTHIDQDAYTKPLLFFFVLVAFIYFYKKVYMLFSVDKVLLVPESLMIGYKEKAKKYPIENIGLKIVHETNGTKTICLYDQAKNKEIFYCKKNDLDKDQLNHFFEQLLSVAGADRSIYDKGTHGEIVSLGVERVTDSDVAYVQKKYFFDYLGYGWLIYPFVVIVILATLYFVN